MCSCFDYIMHIVILSNTNNKNKKDVSDKSFSFSEAGGFNGHLKYLYMKRKNEWFVVIKLYCVLKN